jgi:dethiobiotin synthetase
VSACFVTSSGTGIGKTVVMCSLIRALRAEGVAVRAVKPVATGYSPDTSPETVATSDTGRILAALGLTPTPENINNVSPWRFKAPLAPHMAASREGRALDMAEIVSFCRNNETGEGVLLVEGIGGAMVPLTERETVADLMAALGYPALVVVGSYLGSLSHTLTAAAALAARNIGIKAVMVSESEQSPVPLAETVETLTRFLAPVPVFSLPRAGGDGEASAAIADLITARGAPAAP